MNSIPAGASEKPSTPASITNQGNIPIHRLETWADTCKDVGEMGLRTPAVMTLYQKYGCRFLAPSHDQIRAVLDALDSAMSGWEEQHPELFYQALELNFPELVRHR